MWIPGTGAKGTCLPLHLALIGGVPKPGSMLFHRQAIPSRLKCRWPSPASIFPSLITLTGEQPGLAVCVPPPSQQLNLRIHNAEMLAAAAHPCAPWELIHNHHPDQTTCHCSPFYDTTTDMPCEELVLDWGGGSPKATNSCTGISGWRVGWGAHSAPKGAKLRVELLYKGILASPSRPGSCQLAYPAVHLLPAETGQELNFIQNS